jgi:hypothetical protein
LRQVDRQRQPGGAGADHYHRVSGNITPSPILIGVATISELGL